MTGARDAAVAAFFDRCAIRGLMAEFVPNDEKRLARLLALWRILPGQRVLEPGCGSGRLTERLARIVKPPGAVIAFDLSTEMLLRASRRVLPAPAAALMRASVTSIPVADAGIDRVICFNAFPHFENAGAAIEEIRRVLRPGGCLWIAHLESREIVNQRHIDAADEIGGHLLPPSRSLADLLKRHDFKILLCEESSSYCVGGLRR
ncbi:MAG: class I SAM-dependent methyltransferase [Vicinamibacteria bacterium]|nr:class I SAM-dependent methyltransferase [Vicinamibacteria bacterium]